MPALEQFLGSTAGLSAATVTRLSSQWQDDYQTFCRRDLSGADYVYVWADGIHVRVRLEDTKLCLLVVVGVRADGRKELIALADGYRQSTESWADLLRDAARRGMRAPVLAVADGALGFSGALREVFPQTREQRDWVHKTANVLSALPRSAHPGAKKALQEIYHAEDRRHLLRLSRRALGASAHLKPHRIYLRDRAPSDQGHQGARLPSGRRGHGIQAHPISQDRWRAVNAPHLVPLVRAGARFVNGQLVERPNEHAA